MLLRASLKTSLILVKYLCNDLRNCFYFILYWNVQKWYSTSVGLFRNYSTWITFIRLFQSLLGHFSLFFSSVLRETPFSRSCRIDKCPAVCVNGADESVREKRRHIVGVKTFIDKKNILKKCLIPRISGDWEKVLKRIHFRMWPLRQDVGLKGLRLLPLPTPIINYAPLIRLSVL